MSTGKRLGASLIMLVLLGLVGALAIAPVVRARVASAAAARHLDVKVGGVGLGWFAVLLRDLRIAPLGTPITVEVREVRVEVSPFFSVSRIELHQGVVRIEGEPEDVVDAIRRWRHDGGRGDAARRPPVPLAADGLSLVWHGRADEHDIEVEASGGALSREGGRWRLAFETCKARGAAIAVELTQPALRIGEGGLLDDVQAARIGVVWTKSTGATTSPAISSGEPIPPPLPLVGGASPTPPGEDDGSSVGHLRLPDLQRLRARLVVLSTIVKQGLGEGARVDVESLAFEIGEGERRLAIGHGPLRAIRKGNSFELTFSTQSDARGTPVSLSATLPLEAGDGVVVLEGGPVSLALLGVDEGVGGLIEVGRTTVTGHGRASLDAGRGTLTFDAALSVRALSINRPSIANEVVRGVDATVVARGVLDERGSLRIDDGEISLGALRVSAHGNAEQAPDHLNASLGFEVPTTLCQALLQSIPSALVPTLDGAGITGTLGARGILTFDSRKLDDLVLDWKVDDRCSMSAVPEPLAKERFAQPFEHTIYLPDGTLAQETTGPTTENWTSLARISPYMQVAVLTTEDGAFYRHQGFNRAAMRNALVADLKAGRFVRGASTITMQLAKNLFLFREKTLSRKLEEIILADYMEENFTKKEMMELYLNVIEFGPNVYGVTHAALRYFGRKPDELNLAESLFLASLLPSPLRFAKLAEKPRLAEGWAKHLRQLMAIAAKNELISEAELAEGLKEEVVFHDPKDPLPPPRPPVTGAHFQPPREEDEAEWSEARGN